MSLPWCCCVEAGQAEQEETPSARLQQRNAGLLSPLGREEDCSEHDAAVDGNDCQDFTDAVDGDDDEHEENLTNPLDCVIGICGRFRTGGFSRLMH